jgi:hypothetical protein
MPDDAAPALDPTRIRIGLVIVTVVVLACVVLALVVDAVVVKALMFAIAFTALVRAYLLFRALRADARS